jgi:NAD(P)-dependent dehydrogenase (short-subunit alcohol dehydrogenase family)
MSNLIKDLFNIRGKVALITGASGGFGQAASIGLCQAGVKVMITGRHEEKLKTLQSSLQSIGGTCDFAVGHPDDAVEIEQIVNQTVTRFGGIDILITAAGMNKPQPIIEQLVDEWQSIIDANLRGTYLACKAAGKVMVEQKRGGKVILVSSTRGKLGMANYSAYCPSKGAVDSLTQTLACEWGPYGINVNAIAPTVFRTDLTQWIFDDKEVYQRFLTRIPLGRLAEPEDFIGTVIYLSSRASDFMTGAILYVDGGYTAG